MRKHTIFIGLLAALVSIGIASCARANDEPAPQAKIDAPATPAKIDAPTAQGQIEQVVAQFQAAIIAHDQAALEALFIAEGGSWFQVTPEQSRVMSLVRSRVHADDFHHFATFIGTSKQPIEEKFSNVRILTDGAIASVYFDFSFLVGGKVNNVGSEAWQLVNTDEGWKISAMAYSSYPSRTR